eukprot:1148366-Rhodomonas_salina.1
MSDKLIQDQHQSYGSCISSISLASTSWMYSLFSFTNSSPNVSDSFPRTRARDQTGQTQRWEEDERDRTC